MDVVGRLHLVVVSVAGFAVIMDTNMMAGEGLHNRASRAGSGFCTDMGCGVHMAEESWTLGSVFLETLNAGHTCTEVQC